MKKCINCNIDYPEEEYFYKKNPRTGNKVNSVQCKPCFDKKVKANKQKYYQANKERVAEYNSSPEIKKRRNIRKKARKQEEPEFKTIESLKARIHEVLKGYKGCSSSSLLNCTREQLYKWLEYNFVDGMTWDNYGVIWHIDHVVPIAFFNNTDKDEQRLCFNWSNLRPLLKEQNIAKSSKINKDYILNHYKSIKQFYEINQGYQVNIERCLWQRLELWYGNNSQDNSAFNEQLRWAIRSHASKSVID